MIPIAVVIIITEDWDYSSGGCVNQMGRTIPSFRIALAMEEKEEWKPFRNALDKSDRKKYLMRCGTFPNRIFQPALILFSAL